MTTPSAGKDPFRLEGKVIVVAGGNAGIGMGFARGLVRAGASVSIWGRRKEKNLSAVAELNSLGGRASSREVDVSDRAQVNTAMAAAVEELGRVDGVICNAGLMTSSRSFLDMSTEAYLDLLAVNQHGTFHVAQEAARHMKARWDRGDPGGSILFCASLSALTGTVGMQHYNAAKGAVVGLARGIAVEGGRYGVRCNVVCPGYTISESVVDPGEGTKFGDHVRHRTPIPRFGEPADFEGIAVYFMSDASRFHTGDLVRVDGGWMVNAGKSNLSEVGIWP